MFTSVDASVMRNINKQTVLSFIYRQDQTSRVAISQKTGLNRATVSSLVDELIVEKFVTEVGLGTSKGGRKPILLAFNANAGYAIGMDVQISHVYTVLINAAGQVMYEHRLEVGPSYQPLTTSLLLDALTQEIDSARQNCPQSPHGIFGIGIGLPGLVNHDTGHVFYLPNLQITEWPIVEQLSMRLNLPVYIDNDANCGAWAEFMATRITNLLFINAGIGVGAGMVIDGKLYRGRDGIAGEAGHTTISTIGVLCSCGNYGCWEQYASEQALARYLSEQGEIIAQPFLPDFVMTCVKRAGSGEKTYLAALRSLGESLGIGLSNLVNTLNPNTVYLGGTISEASHITLPEIHRVLRHRAMWMNKDIPIRLSSLRSVAIGAAGLALSKAIDILPQGVKM
ncbi:MAG: ROK family protein [Sulfobacillus sp.]